MRPTHTRGPPGSSSPAACRRWPDTRCPVGAGHSCGHGHWCGCGPGPAARCTHHEVPAQHQGHNLRLRRRIAIVITGQVSAAPPARPATRLPVVARAEHAVEAEQQQYEDDARGQAKRCHPGPRGIGQLCPGPSPPAASPSRALLVQGDISVGLRHAWPPGASLPESTRPGLRRGPGTLAVLRVPPLQGLPWVQVERDWDDRQQADVPGTGQGQLQPGGPQKSPCCC